MLALLKLGCLAIYALALAAFFGLWGGAVALGVEYLAAVMIVIHVIELPFFIKYLRAGPGPLAASVAQSLLFGVLHSLPIKRAVGG